MPRTKVLIWAILLGLALWACIFNTRVETEFSLFLPRSSTVQERFLVDQLRQGPGSHLVIISIEGGDTKTLADISSRLGKKLRQSPLFSQALNGENMIDEKAMDFLFRNRYLLSPTVTSERFSAEELRRILIGKLKSLSVSSGMLDRRFFQRDPTGELLSMLGSWQNKPAIQKERGVWFSGNNRKALLVAEISADGFNLDDFDKAISEVKQTLAEMSPDPGIHMEVVGPPAYAVASRASIRKDIALLSIIATFLVVGILFLAYRSFALVLLSLVPLGSAMAASVALVSFTFNGIHGITMAFGIVVMGVAVDYPIHLFNHLREGEKALASMKRIWPTLRLGAVTTILGYFSMFFSGFDGLIQLACFSVTGLLTAALVTRYVLPHLIPAGMFVSEDSPFTPAAKFLQHRERGNWIVIIFLGGALVFLSLHNKTMWEEDVARLSPVPKKQIDLDKQARKDLNLPDAGYIVAVMGKGEQSVLKITERLGEKFSALKEKGEIDGFDSASIYLPSVSAQKKRLAALPSPEELAVSLQSATHLLPFRPDTFKPFIEEISSAKNAAILTLENIGGTVLHSRVKNLLFRQGDTWYSMITFHGAFDIDKLTEAIGPFSNEGVFGIELRSASNEMVSRYRNRGLLLFGIGFIAIIITLRIGLASWSRAARIVIPLASSVLTAAAILVFFGIKISLFHLAASLLVVGLGLDYALFLNREESLPGGRARTCHALLVCNLSTLSVFGALSFSATPVLSAIGSTVALGAFLSLIFSSMFAAHQES